MKQVLITLAWVVAALAVVGIPIIGFALFVAAASIFVGLIVGFFLSVFFRKYTVFEEELGWVLGFCAMIMTGFQLINI